MTAIDWMLMAGWIGFVVVGVAWHGWQMLRDHRARRPVPPRRYLLQRLAIVGGNAAWLALIALSSGVSLLNLAFGFGLCVIPAIAMGLEAGYRMDKSRYELLRNQGRVGSQTDQ